MVETISPRLYGKSRLPLRVATLRCSRHRGGEAIAQAVDGLDPPGISSVVTKLAPQPLNVFFQRVSALGVVGPDGTAN